MPERRAKQSKRLTVAGLIAVSAATLLMMGWAIFPGAAFADENVNTPWGGMGSNNLPCNGTTHWNLTGFGAQASEVVGNPVLNITGFGSFPMSPQGNIWTVFVSANLPANITASASWVWDQSDETKPSPVLTISDCVPRQTTTTETETTTTETETTSTETTTTETETTSTETTTTETETTSSSTTPPSSSTMPPSSSTTPPSSTTETTPTSVSGTSVTPPGSSSTPPEGTSVLPTTVTPGGTAFTGIENVVPLGAISLLLLTGGSGLMWAGSRRRRKDEDED